MSAKVFILLLGVILCSSVNTEYPDEPKPCRYGDYGCIKAFLKYIATQKFEGDESIGLLSIDPLDVKRLHINRGGDGPVSIDLLVTNGKGIGLKTLDIVNITGFSKDIATKHEIIAKAEKLFLMGDYTINGKVLILPLSGAGKCNFTLIEPIITIGWMGVPYEKDGAIYMKLGKHYMDIKANGLIFNFENLFNDKTLSDNTNKFLTENWREMYEELREPLSHGYSLITRKLISQVFAKYPYEKYFQQ